MAFTKSRNATCSVATYARRVAWLPMRAETLKGHLDGIMLAVLEPGPRHGYAIMEALRIRSDGRVDLPTGTVYPALHRLERRAWFRGAGQQTAGAAAASTS